jgi:hypothetical protein
MFLFGIELPGGGSADANTGFDFNVSENTEFDTPPIHIWVFTITPGVTASVSMNTTGKLAPTGIIVSISPQATLGLHVLGGIDLGEVSGGVDAHIDLLDITTPISAQAGWSLSTLPQSCGATVTFALKGDLQISSGGGEVDLVATFGPCPFCLSASWTLFNWAPLLTSDSTLFDIGLTSPAPVPLPVQLCTQPLNVSIGQPGQTAQTGVPVPLSAVASNDAGQVSNCANFSWQVVPPDFITFVNGCPSTVTFNQVGQRSIQLNAFDVFPDQFGRLITDSGSASESVNVSALAPGAYIVATNPAVDNPTPYNGQTLNIGFFTLGPGTVQLTGQVVGFTGTNSSWTATDSHGNTVSLGSGLSVNWTALTFDFYTVTMTTTDPSGRFIGNATMTVNLFSIPR